LRIEPSEILGRAVLDYVVQEERPRLTALLERTATHQRRTRGEEFHFQRIDGGTLAVLVSAALVREEDKKPLEYSLVVSDVQELQDIRNELHARAVELEKTNEELRKLDKAKDTLLSNVSHELRTPLATIDGYIDMLRDGELGPVENA